MSCNVHTSEFKSFCVASLRKPCSCSIMPFDVSSVSANVGDLVRWSDEAYGGKGYRIKSLGAIDLFPQTHHTEGLLVLEREL